MMMMMRTNEHDLADHGHLLVRRALDRDDWICNAILDLAANGQREWDLAEWTALLTELETSDMTVAEFLDFYA